MNRLKQTVIMLALFFGIGGLFVPSAVGAVDALSGVCANNIKSAACDVCANNKDSVACKNTTQPADLAKIVIDTLLFIVGAIAVVMIIIGGIIYATSAGDSGKVTQGKNTVLYAVIGLVVALLAFAIVSWVTDSFKVKTKPLTNSSISAITLTRDSIRKEL